MVFKLLRNSRAVLRGKQPILRGSGAPEVQAATVRLIAEHVDQESVHKAQLLRQRVAVGRIVEPTRSIAWSFEEDWQLAWQRRGSTVDEDEILLSGVDPSATVLVSASEWVKQRSLLGSYRHQGWRKGSRRIAIDAGKSRLECLDDR